MPHVAPANSAALRQLLPVILSCLPSQRLPWCCMLCLLRRQARMAYTPACPLPSCAQVLPTALRGAFQSCGQNCAGAERFIVHEKVFGEIVR